MKSFFISFMVSVFTSYFTIAMIAFFNPEDLWSSKTLVVQFLLANGLGLMIGCANLLFKIQHWPNSAVLATHYVIVLFVSFFIGYFGNWYDIQDLGTMFSLWIRVTIVYAIVWIALELKQKQAIKQMNAQLQKNRGESS